MKSRLQTFTRLMNFANAASCCLMMSLVGSIGQLAGLLVDLLGGEVDEHFRLAEHLRIDRGQRHAQVILHARAADLPGGRRLQAPACP